MVPHTPSSPPLEKHGLKIVSGPFTYAALGEKASEAHAAAERIRGHMTATKTSIFEIGCDLRMIKAQLTHGHFSKWIAAEFGMSERTAQRYMAVAERFADKPHLLAALPVRVIYALAAPSTPSGFTDMKLCEIEDGPIPTEQEILAEITTAKMHVAEPQPAQGSPLIKAMTKEGAAAEAAQLLRKRLGKSFPHFVELIISTDFPSLLTALDHVSEGGAA